MLDRGIDKALAGAPPGAKGGLPVAAAVCLLFCIAGACCAGAGQEGMSAGEYEALREKALERQRRIIFNSDGGDATTGGYGRVSIEDFDSLEAEGVAERFLDIWSAPLADTHTDSIFYCSSRPFGMFLHRTEIGEMLTSGENNIVGLLDLHGTCPLEVQADFAGENDMEIFFSMRMNDTHDQHTPRLLPRLKKENPGYLLGDGGKAPVYGRWTGVDYAHPEVRELAFRYFEEVCRKFDIDGIELDFFRKLTFFRHERNEPAGREELEMMTGLIRRIRRMTEEVGREKGRPILVAVRVPDSVEYCRAIGLDIERWLEEGLVDIMSVSGEWRMNPWEYSVELGRKYGVKVYAVLTCNRHHVDGLRRTDEAFRGRAMSAWEAGVDGIYTFNFFQTRRPVFSEMGDPEVLSGLDKVYHVSPKGHSTAFADPYPYFDYINVPVLSPNDPLIVPAGSVESFEITVGDDAGGESPPEVRLVIRGNGALEAGELGVKINGVALSDASAEPAPGGVISLFAFSIGPEMVEKGVNVIEVSAVPGSAGLYLEDIYLEVNY